MIATDAVKNLKDKNVFFKEFLKNLKMGSESEFEEQNKNNLDYIPVDLSEFNDYTIIGFNSKIVDKANDIWNWKIIFKKKKTIKLVNIIGEFEGHYNNIKYHYEVENFKNYQ